MTRFTLSLTLALLLTGCSTSLPSMHTEGPYAGRCVTINYLPLLDLGAYYAADLMDGWKCVGLADGELPRTGTKAEFNAEVEARRLAAQKAGTKWSLPPGPSSLPALPAPAPAPAAPTWATGD